MRQPPGLQGEELLEWHGWAVTPAGCWEWSGRTNSDGYGIYGGKPRSVHRLAYEVWVGPIPPKKLIRHRCDNPPCINPAHLLIGTHQDNMDDMAKRGRRATLPGSKNPKAKLTEEEVRFVRSAYAEGLVTQSMLGEMFGVSRTGIGFVARGETWLKT